MQVDTRERGFSYAYDAPLDMRMDPTQELTRARDRQHVGRAPPGARCCASYGEERYAGAIARAIVRAARDGADRDHAASSSTSIKAAIPAPARFAGGHPAKRTFQALRIAVNDELGQLDARAPARLGAAARRAAARRDLVPLARGPPRQALPRRPRAGLHLPARPARLRLRPRARGRAADPPRRSRPRPARSRANPRSKSARLRAARKLTRTSRRMSPAAAPHASRAAAPRRGAAPRRARPRRVSGPARARADARRARRRRRRSRSGCSPALERAARPPPARPPDPRARVDRRRRLRADRASSPCRSRCSSSTRASAARSSARRAGARERRAERESPTRVGERIEAPPRSSAWSSRPGSCASSTRSDAPAAARRGACRPPARRRRRSRERAATRRDAAAAAGATRRKRRRRRRRATTPRRRSAATSGRHGDAAAPSGADAARPRGRGRRLRAKRHRRRRPAPPSGIGRDATAGGGAARARRLAAMALVERRIGLLFALFLLLLVLAGARTLDLGAVKGGTLRKRGHRSRSPAKPCPRSAARSPTATASSSRSPSPPTTSPPTPYLIKDPPARGRSARAAPRPAAGRRCCASSPAATPASSTSRARCPARQADAIAALKIPGIELTPVDARIYPRGSLASQVLGRGRHRRQRPRRPRVLARTRAARRRRRAPARQGRARPADLDRATRAAPEPGARRRR